MMAYASHLIKIFRSLLFHDVNHVVNGDPTYKPPFAVHHRDGNEIIFLEYPGHIFLV